MERKNNRPFNKPNDKRSFGNRNSDEKRPPRKEFNRDDSRPPKRDFNQNDSGFQKKSDEFITKPQKFSFDNRGGGARGGYRGGSSGGGGYRGGERSGGFGGGNRSFGGGNRSEGGGFNGDRGGEGRVNREGGFNKDRGEGNREGGARREGGFNRDRSEGRGNREGGFRREGNDNTLDRAKRKFEGNREGSGGGEDRRPRRSEGEGGARREGGYQGRSSGGYQGGERSGGSSGFGGRPRSFGGGNRSEGGGGFNRDRGEKRPEGEGGARREGGYQGRSSSGGGGYRGGSAGGGYRGGERSGGSSGFGGRPRSFGGGNRSEGGGFNRDRGERSEGRGNREGGFNRDRSEGSRENKDSEFQKKPIEGELSEQSIENVEILEETPKPPRKKIRINKDVDVEPILMEEEETRRTLIKDLKEDSILGDSNAESDEEDETPKIIRINRFLSKCGLGARREVENLVLEGRIKVNGEVVTNFSRKVNRDIDKVTLDDGHIEVLSDNVVLAFNKPIGFLCSHKDVHHDKLVFNLLPVKYRKFNMAGRLDLTSRGLMIFTMNGDLINSLTHPSHSIMKKYKLTVDNLQTEESMSEQFLHGIDSDGELLRAKSVEVTNREKNEVVVVLQEGKKRQLHRMFEGLGIKILDLQRIAIGKLNLEDLKIEEGQYKEIEIRDILD